MNNDLISREALKEAINKIIDEEIKIDEKWARGLKYSLKIINDAPTVDPCKDCEDRRQAEYIRHSSSWHELQSLRKYKEEHERSQGEWTITDIGLARCPFCNCERQYPENYCGYCGADLRSEDNV